ncbi:STAS domain-containing protein [Streptomycetaceae bacterium NBC_01309]
MPNSRPVPLHLTIYRCDTTAGALLTLQGEIDLATEPQLRGSMTRCLTDGHSAIDVDLSDVTFRDSGGLHVFLDISRDAAKAGGYLRLHNPNPIVARLLTLTGTGTLVLGLPTHPSPPKRTIRVAAPVPGSTETGQVILFARTAANAAAATAHPQAAHRTRAGRVRGWLSGDRVREALLGNSRASLGSALVSQAQRATHEVTQAWRG